MVTGKRLEEKKYTNCRVQVENPGAYEEHLRERKYLDVVIEWV